MSKQAALESRVAGLELGIAQILAAIQGGSTPAPFAQNPPSGVSAPSGLTNLPPQTGHVNRSGIGGLLPPGQVDNSLNVVKLKGERTGKEYEQKGYLTPAVRKVIHEAMAAGGLSTVTLAIRTANGGACDIATLQLRPLSDDSIVLAADDCSIPLAVADSTGAATLKVALWAEGGKVQLKVKGATGVDPNAQLPQRR